ncbi:MAG: hypothetical protein K2L64_02795 [Ureaplasma sp.]|nr:hypothetical protein [Ureaplasma sp.]
MNKLVDFEIRRIKENEIFFICSTYYGFQEFVKEIEEYLSEINFSGDVIVDNIILNYDEDSERRFAKYIFKNNKLDISNRENIRLDKNNIYRKMTSEYFLSTVGKKQEAFLIQEFVDRLVKGEIL